MSDNVSYLSYLSFPLFFGTLGLSWFLQLLDRLFVILGLFFLFSLFVVSNLIEHWEGINEWWQKGYEPSSREQKYYYDMYLATVENRLSTVERQIQMLLTVENKNGVETSTSLKVETPLQEAILPIKGPSKEDLLRLKEALNIKKGCLQWKKSGNKIYKIQYDVTTRKKKWTKLGSWDNLQKLLS